MVKFKQQSAIDFIIEEVEQLLTVADFEIWQKIKAKAKEIHHEQFIESNIISYHQGKKYHAIKNKELAVKHSQTLFEEFYL